MHEDFEQLKKALGTGDYRTAILCFQEGLARLLEDNIDIKPKQPKKEELKTLVDEAEEKTLLDEAFEENMRKKGFKKI